MATTNASLSMRKPRTRTTTATQPRKCLGTTTIKVGAAAGFGTAALTCCAKSSACCQTQGRCIKASPPHSKWWTARLQKQPYGLMHGPRPGVLKFSASSSKQDLKLWQWVSPARPAICVLKKSATAQHTWTDRPGQLVVILCDMYMSVCLRAVYLQAL